tara:strand:+ start:28581 stop:30080 length:1500 start_codon:yes stop_codon:yes gene_type:complete
MVVSPFTSNNKPVGIGYDSRSRAKALTELTAIEATTITVTDVSTVRVFAECLETSSGGTLLINGAVSAVSFIGASGSGASALVDMTDVDIPTLAGHINRALVITPAGVVSAVSAVDEFFNSVYEGASQNLTDIGSLTPVANNAYLVNSAGDIALTSYSTFAQAQAALTTAIATRSGLGLGALATSDSLDFSSLSDVDAYSVGDANYLVLVNAAGNGVTYTPSSLLAGNSPSAHGALSDLSALSAHDQYMDISAIRGFINAVNASAIPSAGNHLTNVTYVDTQTALRQLTHVNLTELAALTASPGGVLYWDTGGALLNAASLAFGRSLLNSVNAAATRTLLALGSLALSSNLSATQLDDFQDFEALGAADGDLLYVAGGSPRTIGYQSPGAIAHADLGTLTADDHLQYSRVDGTRQFTLAPSAATDPITGPQLARKSWVDTQIGTRQESSTLLDDIVAMKGSLATGDIIYWDGTDFVTLAAGTNGDVLTLAGGVPTWGAP